LTQLSHSPIAADRSSYQIAAAPRPVGADEGSALAKKFRASISASLMGLSAVTPACSTKVGGARRDGRGQLWPDSMPRERIGRHFDLMAQPHYGRVPARYVHVLRDCARRPSIRPRRAVVIDANFDCRPVSGSLTPVTEITNDDAQRLSPRCEWIDAALGSAPISLGGRITNRSTGVETTTRSG